MFVGGNNNEVKKPEPEGSGGEIELSVDSDCGGEQKQAGGGSPINLPIEPINPMGPPGAVRPILKMPSS